MGALSFKNAHRKHPLYTQNQRGHKKGPIPVLNEFLVLFKRHDLHTKKEQEKKAQNSIHPRKSIHVKGKSAINLRETKTSQES